MSPSTVNAEIDGAISAAELGGEVPGSGED